MGVGTSSPASKFEVQIPDGPANTVVASFNQSVTGQPSPRKVFIVPSLSGAGYNNSSQNGDAGIFWTDGLAAPGHNSSAGFVIGPWDGGVISGLRVSHEGNVGIGADHIPTDPISSERFKLAVGGKVIATEYVARLTNDWWPDYVFNKSYELPDLDDVEEFVKEMKHLPGIPSAKEIEKNGLSLTEMSKLQMEKIEELTLQIIKMNKIIKEQNQRLRSLEVATQE